MMPWNLATVMMSDIFLVFVTELAAGTAEKPERSRSAGEGSPRSTFWCAGGGQNSSGEDRALRLVSVP